MTTYALDSLALFVCGRAIGGFGEGGAVNIEFEQEEWENKSCVDGKVISSKILAHPGTVEITLRYDSPSNQVLQRMADARSVGTFTCQYPNGDLAHSDDCRVQKRPGMADSTSPGDRVWMLYLQQLEVTFAGGA